MTKKLTFEYVRDFVNNENLLISKQYVNSKTKLDILCKKCDEIYSQCFSDYKKGCRHQKCSNRENGIKSGKVRRVYKTLEDLRVCKYCGNNFIPKRKESTCCSRLCANKLLNSDIDKNRINGEKGGIISSSKIINRSKGEIYFANLCIDYFTRAAISCNNLFFKDKNGKYWDADIIIHHLKIAILYNGIWHYKKVCKNHKLERTISRDKLKEHIITENGYSFYIIKDLGKFNKSFVENEFYLFVHKLNFKIVLDSVLGMTLNCQSLCS